MKSGIKIVKFLQSEGFQAFYVGGVVRDRLLKRESNNLDITTDATPDEVEKILTKKGFTVKPLGKKFGTILTVVDSMPVEITTFRSEGRYSDKRHPDQVAFIKNYLDDAKRRDFTINALYYDPIKDQIYDPTGGQKDLKAKLLRFVGDPKKRIDEDALRMLRAVRLSIQLGFKLEKNTFAAIKTRAKYIQGISGERIKAELDKILLSENRAEGLRLMEQTGLLKFVLPEVDALKDFSHHAKEFHLEGDMFEHTLLAVQNVKPGNLDLVYAVLLHDIGKPFQAQKTSSYIKTHGHAEVGAKMFQKIAQRLKFSKESRKLIEWAIANHMATLRFPDLSDKEKALLALHPDIDFLLELSKADDSANLRKKPDGSIGGGGSKKLPLAEEFINQAKKQKPLISKLARADLVMKYSEIHPGPKLGQKIMDIKIQIALGKIKSEKELQSYLAT